MNRRKKLYLFLIILNSPITGFGIDVYTPSLPSMSEQLHALPATVKMTVSLYLIGLCFGQVTFGALSDTYGRRATLLTGFAGMIATNLMIAGTTHIQLILLARLVQGFFVGAISVSSRCMVADIFDKQELPFISIYTGMAWSVGAIVAPVIGSYLQYFFSWPSNFYFLATYGALAAAAFVVFAEETNRHKTRHSVAEIAAGYVTILTHRRFMGALLLMAISNSIVVIFPLVSAFLVQRVFHQSAIVYGHLALTTGLVYLAGSFMNRYVLKWRTSDQLIKMGVYALVSMTVIFVAISLAVPETLATLYGSMILITLSLSLIFPNCMGKAISQFPHMAGKAGAVIGTGCMFISACASVICNYLPLHTQLSVALIFAVFASCGIYAVKLLEGHENTVDFGLEMRHVDR